MAFLNVSFLKVLMNSVIYLKMYVVATLGAEFSVRSHTVLRGLDELLRPFTSICTYMLLTPCFYYYTVLKCRLFGFLD